MYALGIDLYRAETHKFFCAYWKYIIAQVIYVYQ